MKKVTSWTRYNFKKKEFEHNHIEDSWVDTDKLIPRFPSQKSWKGGKWKKEFGYLDSNFVYHNKT